MSSLRPITPVENPIVETERLRKVYGSGDLSVTALQDVDITFGRGQFTAIMGPSGSGKSTLMHCTAGLDSISSGIVKVNGSLISSMSPGQRTTFRRDHVGFIFQAFNLIPSLSALENITLPSDIAGRKIDKDRFDAVISALGIGNRLDHRPAELSGGQQQRVACARALVADAAVVFADEPTGNLDSEATDSVLGFIRYAVDELGQSVIMVTHEPTAASWADRVVFLRDGDVHAEMLNPDTDSVLDALRTFSAQGRELSHAAGGVLGQGAKAGLAHPDAAPAAAPFGMASSVSQGLAPTPMLIDRDENGEKAFSIPGLGKVVVTGDVHVHVYDQEAEPDPHHSGEGSRHESFGGDSGWNDLDPAAVAEDDPFTEAARVGQADHLAQDSPFNEEGQGDAAPTAPPPGSAQPHEGEFDRDRPHDRASDAGPYMPVEQYGFLRGEER